MKKESAAAHAETNKQLNLEDAFIRLEEAVVALEQDDLSLEDSFQIYKNGMDLVKQCNDAIVKVEKKVLILNEDGETHEF